MASAPVTYQLEAADGHHGKMKHLEAAVLGALRDGDLKLFVVGADGAKEEVHVSEADHSGGHSTFDPHDPKKDHHGPHRHGRSASSPIVFTLAPVPAPPSGDHGAPTA